MGYVKLLKIVFQLGLLTPCEFSPICQLLAFCISLHAPSFFSPLRYANDPEYRPFFFNLCADFQKTHNICSIDVLAWSNLSSTLDLFSIFYHWCCRKFSMYYIFILLSKYIFSKKISLIFLDFWGENQKDWRKRVHLMQYSSTQLLVVHRNEAELIPQNWRKMV